MLYIGDDQLPPGDIGIVTSYHEDPHKPIRIQWNVIRFFNVAHIVPKDLQLISLETQKKTARFSQLFWGSPNGSPREISRMISPHFLLRVDFLRSHKMITESTLNPPLVLSWCCTPRKKNPEKMVENFTKFGIRRLFFDFFCPPPHFRGEYKTVRGRFNPPLVAIQPPRPSNVEVTNPPSPITEITGHTLHVNGGMYMS